MRINDPNASGISSATVGIAKNSDGTGKTGGRQGTSGASGSSDEIQLSRLAGHLTDAQGAVSGSLSCEETSPERQARIDQLAALVQSGSYNPDPTAIAQAMVDEAKAFGAASS
jgi:flagellar biosynthesis anti-sigma factor FlgM